MVVDDEISSTMRKFKQMGHSVVRAVILTAPRLRGSPSEGEGEARRGDTKRRKPCGRVLEEEEPQQQRERERERLLETSRISKRVLDLFLGLPYTALRTSSRIFWPS